jgi:sensor histidine kinase YesM
MLQPIVENSVSHGIRSSNVRCCVKIKIHKKNNYLRIDVIDNGCGMTKETLKELKLKINDAKSKNIGLTNLNRRLILYYGEYSRLRIRSKKDMGIAISFLIPIDLAESKPV